MKTPRSTRPSSSFLLRTLPTVTALMLLAACHPKSEADTAKADPAQPAQPAADTTSQAPATTQQVAANPAQAVDPIQPATSDPTQTDPSTASVTPAAGAMPYKWPRTY